MSNEQDLSQEGKKIPEIDLNSEPDSHETGSDEIIELTDVVSEGTDPMQPDTDAPLLLDEEKPDLPRDEPAENVSAGDAGGTNFLSSWPETSEEIESAPPEDDFSALESSDFKFENDSAFETTPAEPFPEQSEERLDDVLADLEEEVSSFEKPEDILASLEKDESEDPGTPLDQPDEFLPAYEKPGKDEESVEDEKPLDALAALDEEDRVDETPDAISQTQDIPGISEEKMKKLLTEVIQETVDKAVRETVSEVTEKVIREAIETLKQSIASSEP